MPSDSVRTIGAVAVVLGIGGFIWWDFKERPVKPDAVGQTWIDEAKEAKQKTPATYRLSEREVQQHQASREATVKQNMANVDKYRANIGKSSDYGKITDVQYFEQGKNCTMSGYYYCMAGGGRTWFDYCGSTPFDKE